MKELASNKHGFVHLNKINYTNCSLHNSPLIIQQLGSWDYLWVMWLSCVVLWMPLSSFLHLIFFWKNITHFSLIHLALFRLTTTQGKKIRKYIFFFFFLTSCVVRDSSWSFSAECIPSKQREKYNKKEKKNNKTHFVKKVGMQRTKEKYIYNENQSQGKKRSQKSKNLHQTKLSLL